jgi:hypothetical protein
MRDEPIAPTFPYTRRELAHGLALIQPYPKARRWAHRLARWHSSIGPNGGIIAFRPPRGWPVARTPRPDVPVAPSAPSELLALMALASPRVRTRIEARLEAERADARARLALLAMLRGRGVRDEVPGANEYGAADRLIAEDRAYWAALLADVAAQVRAWQRAGQRCGSRLTFRST